MDIYQPGTEADQEEITVHQERMRPSMNPCRNKMNARREAMEAYTERTGFRNHWKPKTGPVKVSRVQTSYILRTKTQINFFLV
jgi:hypothetical protein